MNGFRLPRGHPPLNHTHTHTPELLSHPPSMKPRIEWEFMNERQGRILRFLKPYIESCICIIWIIETEKKKFYARLLLFGSTLDIIIRVRVNFSTRILPFPVRFDELPGSRNGQGSSALSRREHARDSGPITRLAHYRSAVEWQVRREERARRAHAAACTHTHARLCPFTQKGKAAESGWQSAMT